LLRERNPPHALPQRLGITAERWREIQDACTNTLIALQPESRKVGSKVVTPTLFDVRKEYALNIKPSPGTSARELG
jgi:hypothetical protein